MDVLQAVDRTYAELVDYQEQLERQNAETAMLRRFMESVLGSVSDALIVVDRQGRVEEASRSLGRLANWAWPRCISLTRRLWRATRASHLARRLTN